MKQYKFQALVTPYRDEDGGSREKLSSGSHRVVLRATNSQTHRSQVFSALVDGEDEAPFGSSDRGHAAGRRRRRYRLP
jgi:hypothetical protein